jgi:cell wall-associated NlpC family hydrolase
MTITRQSVADAALSWIKTPYVHGQRLRGKGVDCGMLLIGVYAQAGVIEEFEPDVYPPDWHLHRSEEKFIRIVERFADRVPNDTALLPGDLIVLKYGRCHAHGGIMLDSDRFVHALRTFGEVIVSALSDMEFNDRDPWKYRVRGVE